MDWLPFAFWAIWLSPKRTGKWLFAVSPPVPEHLRNGANSGIESVSCSLPPVLSRAEGVGNFVSAARREKQCYSSSSSSPLSHYTYQEDAAEALVASSSCFSFFSFSLSRLSGEALCLFTLPQPHTWAPSQWDNWLSRTRRGEAHNREEGEKKKKGSWERLRSECWSISHHNKHFI